MRAIMHPKVRKLISLANLKFYCFFAPLLKRSMLLLLLAKFQHRPTNTFPNIFTKAFATKALHTN